MSKETIALVIGGIIPALMFGFANVFTKASTSGSISMSSYVTIVGVAVTVVGVVSGLMTKDGFMADSQSAIFALAVGITWAIGQLLIALVLQKFSVPLSVLAPIYNTNTLVAVLIALIVFSEWSQVSMTHLGIGAFLTTLGGILVAKSLL
ncbi:conserved hypothetical protein [Rippkaea orientalis PCC 8801]|uniref:EamA domain-containing protein n=1 Tax=Rippkaea orientalis (strain PCC 8801 / RF-1) TaxID=41431 RepID=B7K2A6_RIPO1|nr:hypothetical protein [Rippkaea orientalis]ACK65242.1 conserved hypothetical protein [Rippkaea orientalis PCC 8801]